LNSGGPGPIPIRSQVLTLPFDRKSHDSKQRTVDSITSIVPV
jgi:hypothetical protein